MSTSNRITLITPEEEEEGPFSAPSIENLRRQRALNRRKMYCNMCLTLFSYLFLAIIFFDLGILFCIDSLTFNSTNNNDTIIIFNNDIPLNYLIILEGIFNILFMGILTIQIVFYCWYNKN